MHRSYVAAALLLLVVLAASGLRAMPPHPTLAEEMRKAGTLGPTMAYMEGLKARGVNNLEGNKVYDVGPGRKCRYDQNQRCNSDFCHLRQSLVSSVVIRVGWRVVDGDKIMKARISR